MVFGLKNLINCARRTRSKGLVLPSHQLSPLRTRSSSTLKIVSRSNQFIRYFVSKHTAWRSVAPTILRPALGPRLINKRKAAGLHPSNALRIKRTLLSKFVSTVVEFTESRQWHLVSYLTSTQTPETQTYSVLPDEPFVLLYRLPFGLHDPLGTPGPEDHVGPAVPPV